jgi:hypothetical protein
MRPVLRGDADPVITHRKPHRTSLGSGKLDIDAPSARAELDGVVEEIGHDLLEAQGIEPGVEPAWRRKSDLVTRRPRLRVADGLRHNIADVRLPLVEHDPAGTQSYRFEELGHQAPQPKRLLFDS